MWILVYESPTDTYSIFYLFIIYYFFIFVNAVDTFSIIKIKVMNEKRGGGSGLIRKLIVRCARELSFEAAVLARVRFSVYRHTHFPSFQAWRLFLLRGAEGGRTAEDSPCPWDMTTRGFPIFLPRTVEDYLGAPFWQDAGFFRQSGGKFQAFHVFEQPTHPAGMLAVCGWGDVGQQHLKVNV